MAFDPTYLRGCRKQWVGAAVLLLAMAGCQKTTQIGHYQVPKDVASATSQSDTGTTGPDRMIAAIVPHADSAWFFKLAGPNEAVGKHVEAFESLVKSVTFPASAEGKPKWDLPKDWKPTSNEADLRFATLRVSEKPPLDVTVTTLPWPGEHDLELLLSNLNRWRGQMSQTPLDSVDLADQIRTVKLADEEAILVDFRGTQKAAGMQPSSPAVSGAAPAVEQGEKVSRLAEHPPISGHPPISEKLPQGNQQSKASQPGKDYPLPDQPEAPLTFTLPEGWTASRRPQFAVLAFTRTKKSEAVEISVSPFGGAAGGLLANVNRWGAQLKLPEISNEELDPLVKACEVDGRPAQMVELVGPKSVSAPAAIVVVLANRDNVTWFFRMRGDADLCKEEEPNFEKFIASVKFRTEDQ